jgi:hypothetical protein
MVPIFGYYYINNIYKTVFFCFAEIHHDIQIPNDIVSAEMACRHLIIVDKICEGYFPSPG